METQKKYPLFVPTTTARHLLIAVREEIDRLQRIGETLGDNDDWPDDYDPNDLALYRRWGQWLEEASASGGQVDDPTTKPVEFLMSRLPHYAKKNCDVISPGDLEQLFRTYAEYVASYCISSLPGELVRQTNRSDWIQWNLSQLLSFPRTTASSAK